MSALESLARWKTLDTLSMAKLLMDMTAEGRTELRNSYANAVRGDEKIDAPA